MRIARERGSRVRQREADARRAGQSAASDAGVQPCERASIEGVVVIGREIVSDNDGSLVTRLEADGLEDGDQVPRKFAIHGGQFVDSAVYAAGGVVNSAASLGIRAQE